VKRFEFSKKLHRMRTNGLRLLQIHAVPPRRGQHALPSFVLKLAVGGGPRILLGQHLGEDSVAQAEGRIAKPGQPKTLQHLGENLSPGNNDLRAARPDAFHRLAFRQRHLCELRGQLAHIAGCYQTTGRLSCALACPRPGGLANPRARGFRAARFT
jgi:hypothetical protein